MLKPILITILFSIFQFGAYSSIIDSLKEIYPTQPNAEKALTLCELCYQLAYSDTKEAIHYGKLGYEAAEKTEDKALKAQALNDWSIPYLVMGDYDSVFVLCNQSLEIRQELGDSVGVAKLLNKMANAQYERGNLDESLALNLRALDIFESNDLYGYSGRVLSNIGVIYEKSGLIEKALTNYQKAKEIALETDNQNAYYSALSSEAVCLSKSGNYIEADQKLNEALRFYIEEANTDMIAGVYQNLGFNARLNKNTKKGKHYYELAYTTYKNNNNESGLGIISCNLGQVYMDIGQLDSAEAYLAKGLELAKKNHSYYQLSDAYKGLMRLENLKGNFQIADEYFNLYEQQVDSIYNSETATAISEMIVKYDTEAKEKALVNERLANKNNQLLLILSGVIILILILSIILIQYRRKLYREKVKNEELQNLEKERGRIARDLHDNLGAELTLLTSKIDIEAFKNQETTLGQTLDEISEISKNANHQLRETIWSIHKSTISSQELLEKIKLYFDRIKNSASIELKVTNHSSTNSFSPAMGLNIFRICQEALNNAVKYADASIFSIELDTDRLEIMDNGNGFNLQTVRRGYGLNNMEERAKETEGKLTINSDNNGTQIILEFYKTTLDTI